MKIYGYINSGGCLVDTGRTAKGAKKVATIVGAKQMGYRIDYHVTVTHTKVKATWRPLDSLKLEGRTMVYKTAKMRQGAEVIVLEETPKMARVGFIKYDCRRWVNKKSLHNL